jgi:hypothetical protein
MRSKSSAASESRTTQYYTCLNNSSLRASRQTTSCMQNPLQPRTVWRVRPIRELQARRRPKVKEAKARKRKKISSTSPRFKASPRTSLLPSGSVNPADLTSKVQHRPGHSRPQITIPKRGEKDFEPLEETVNLQEMMLQRSREALFGALQGVRGGNR